MALRLSTGLRNKLMDQEAEAVVVLVAQTTIAFDDTGSGPNGGDQITDSGDGLAAAIKKGMITVYGSTSNNGTFKVLSVASDGSYVEVESGDLTAESAGQSVTLVSATGASFADLFRNGVMKIFPGTQPANADLTEGVTELVEITLASGTPFNSNQNGINFGDASAGVLGKDAGEVWSGQASASNTAGWFRFYDKNRTTGASSTAVRFDGAISTAGAQLNMSNTTITSGGTTTIDSVAITLPTQ